LADSKDIFPVFEGKMGSRVYWQTMWGWGRVKRAVSYARDLPDYDSLAPAEKTQRDINESRVTNQIVPYILTNPDRFFGSIIIEGIGTKPEFKPLPGYQGYGELEIDDAVVFFALDGQHRLRAISEAVSSDPDLASEQQSIIIVWRDAPGPAGAVKTRKLFTHLNKYAKPTTASTNILLDDEDIFAEITRKLEREIPLFKNRVNWKGNTLSPTSSHVITAPALKYSVTTLLDDEDINKDARSWEESDINSYFDSVKSVWEDIIDKSPVYADINRGILTMVQLRNQYILMTPVGQMAMISAYQHARNHEMKDSDIATQLGKVDWERKSDLWNRIIFSRDLDRMIPGRENMEAMGRVLGYVLGGNYEQNEKTELFHLLQAYQPERRELPTQIS